MIGEVWKLLSAVKTQFGTFGDALDGVKEKLDQAWSTMDAAAGRSRAIRRKLRKVEELLVGPSEPTLGTNGEGMSMSRLRKADVAIADFVGRSRPGVAG